MITCARLRSSHSNSMLHPIICAYKLRIHYGKEYNLILAKIAGHSPRHLLMRGASRGVREVEQPALAGAENSTGFLLGRDRALPGPVCGARARGSQPRPREAAGPARPALRPVCEELAGREQDEPGNARQARVPGSADLGPVSRRQNRDAKPLMERREASMPIARHAPRPLSSAHTACTCLRRAEIVVRLAALHSPRFYEAGKKAMAYPAPQTTGAMTHDHGVSVVIVRESGRSSRQ